MMKSLLPAIAATLFAIGACALTVKANYKGNWTGLFCVGDRLQQPPSLARGTYLFKNSDGYDGQYYRIIAHDPFFERGYTRYVDHPAMRCRRMLLPVLAWTLALGSEPLIDYAYIGLVWLFLLAGVYWLSRFAVEAGRTAWWGLAYLLIPSTGISVDRMLTDLPMVTLALGFIWHARRNRDGAAWLLLAAACLARETGVFVVGGYCLWLVSRRFYSRAIRLASAVLPLAAWSLFVASHVPGLGIPGHSGAPFVAILRAFPDPLPYTMTGSLLLIFRGMDGLALLAMLVAWALVWTLRKTSPDLFAVGAAFVALGLFMSARTGSTDFIEIYSYGRYYSPILLLLLLDCFRNQNWWRSFPAAIDAVRVGMTFTAQVYWIVKGH